MVILTSMKRHLLLISALLSLMVACSPDGGLSFIKHDIDGAIQKGPFVQGSTIMIQPLNSNLKPTGKNYTTYTSNDAGMFEMEDIESKYVEIIAIGYYFDEANGKISNSPLTLRAIADISDSKQANVNILTTLTYSRIKHLVTNNNESINNASKQAERELYTTLGIPEELQPTASCYTMNIANGEDDNGLLLAISAVLQEERTVGELTEYIAKLSTDFADDGVIQPELLKRFNLNNGYFLFFKERVRGNLQERYKSLGVECEIPDFEKYLPYLAYSDEEFLVIHFTYDKEYKGEWEDWGIIDTLRFESDVKPLRQVLRDGQGQLQVDEWPTIIYKCHLPSLISFDVPEGVSAIGDYAFARAAGEGLNFTTINLPSSLTSIGTAAFEGCTSLTNINIPANVTTIGSGAFAHCSNLVNIVLPEGIEAIYMYTFIACKSLTNVAIPKGVNYIGNLSFASCTNLSVIHCKAVVPPILESNAFIRIAKDCIIYVPEDSVEAYKSADGWSESASIIVGYDFNE